MLRSHPHVHTGLANRTKSRVPRNRVACLKQTETMYVLSEALLSLPEQQRKHYPGTSVGNLIAPWSCHPLNKNGTYMISMNQK